MLGLYSRAHLRPAVKAVMSATVNAWVIACTLQRRHVPSATVSYSSGLISSRPDVLCVHGITLCSSATAHLSGVWLINASAHRPTSVLYTHDRACVYHVNLKTYVASNFNCLIENEGLLKVTGSHAHCIKVVIYRNWCKIEMPLLLTTNRKWRMNCTIEWYMNYWLASLPITVSDLHLWQLFQIRCFLLLCSSWQTFSW